MRKILTFAALVAVAVTACNKLPVENMRPAAPKGEPTNVSFNIMGAAAPTRATEAGITAENTVNTVDVFVFFNGGDYDGQLDAYGHFTTTTGTVKATTGARSIYAVVNSEYDEATLSAIANLADFRALVATLGSQKKGASAPYTLDNFTMIGSADQTLAAGDNAVTVYVDRVAARIRVKKISRDFESSALADQTFIVTDMYVSNAVVKDLYSLSYTPVVADFVNQRGVLSSPEDHALWLHRAGLNQTIADNGNWDSSSSDNYLYTFPNSISTEINGTDGDFAVQCSKLIVKATLNGDEMYYAIPLPALVKNYSYDIEELVITRRGTADPNEKVEVANVNYTITVNPWTLAPIETENGGEAGDAGSKYVI